MPCTMGPVFDAVWHLNSWCSCKSRWLEFHWNHDYLPSVTELVQDAHDSMRNLMWHQNQKALSDFVIAILDEPRT